jgi:hypothetical protein
MAAVPAICRHRPAVLIAVASTEAGVGSATATSVSLPEKAA